MHYAHLFAFSTQSPIQNVAKKCIIRSLQPPLETRTRCHMPFRVDAPYQPTGDQPRAIAQLAEGIGKGYKHQTLLGATGTGKSVTRDTSVFVVEQRGVQRISRVTPIGPLIDSLMAASADRLREAGDTQILDSDQQPVM